MDEATKNLQAQEDGQPSAQPAQPAAVEKKGGRGMPRIAVILIVLVCLALAIWLLLFLASRYYGFGSIPAMFSHMMVQLEVMWQRLTLRG